MKLNDIVLFLRELGVGEINVSDDEEWVRCRCPLAPAFHAKGRDENPSFGIRVNDRGESGYHCFTCRSGRLIDLIHVMNFTTGIRKSACSFFGSHEIWDREESPKSIGILSEVKGYRDVYKGEKKTITSIPIPQNILSAYPRLQDSTHRAQRSDCYEYLESRGIHKESVDLLEVRHNPWKRTLAFSITGVGGSIYSLHFKPATDDEVKVRFWHLTPKNSGYPDAVWGSPSAMFGMKFYDPRKPLLFVESETDVLRLYSLGVGEIFCIIGAAGAVNKYKIDCFRNREVYLGFDNDPAGFKYYKKSLEFFPTYSILHKLDWGVIGKNDPGDLESLEEFNYVLSKKISIGSIVMPTSTNYRDLWA